MPSPALHIDRERVWTNWHNSSGVGGRVERLYTPHNHWENGNRPRKRFLPGLRGLQQVVHDAERDGKRARALGSGWSLSNAAFTDEYLVNTSRLGYWFLGFRTPTMVAPRLRARRGRLVFAQCGVQIKTLNGYLQRQRLALPTSGASNGQTIVGAVSTGTHGSAIDVGSMQDFILGLHIVAEGGKHYWIERKSRPAVTKQFTDWLGARLVRDDDLFKAAVVSFGSFGLIHGMLFEAVPLYLLEMHVQQYDYRDVTGAMRTLDMRSLHLPDGASRPFHFEVVLNPYRTGPGEKGAFVRVLYKRPAGTDLPSSDLTTERMLRSEDLVSIVSGLSDWAPDLIPPLLQRELLDAFEPTPAQGVLGTHAQQFGDSTPTGGGTSLEIGVPLDRVGDAMNALLAVTRQHTFGCPMALRYVKGSDAFLAFTRFKPYTCTIELPGVDADRTREGFERIWNKLRERGIPHTFHWGQALPLNPDWVRAGFGVARVRKWLAARRKLLGPPGREMFSNALLDAVGLAE